MHLSSVFTIMAEAVNTYVLYFCLSFLINLSFKQTFFTFSLWGSMCRGEEMNVIHHNYAEIQQMFQEQSFGVWKSKRSSPWDSST